MTENIVPDWLLDLATMKDEDLHPDLLPYYDDGTREDGTRFPMVRHPLVYCLLPINGVINRAYHEKKTALDAAVAAEDWAQVVWLHERPWRLDALIEHVTGRDDEGTPMSLAYCDQWARDLAVDVWVDSENIEQHIEDWRALFDNGEVPMLGTQSEQVEFAALPWGSVTPGDTLIAFRGGTVGDWSWTTDPYIAGGFAKRAGLDVRYSLIHRSECFGYFTRRGESELMVRLTDERRPLVYPNEVE